jgi:catechol 2,3-dioxygenase
MYQPSLEFAMSVQQHSSSIASIHPATDVGLLALTVADLDRSLAFYTRLLGFELLDSSAEGAVLGAAGTPLLLLAAHKDAAAWPNDRYGYTGLYHFAILMPTRADLGRWLRHWLEVGNTLPGQGDHLVSEALYLSDPDGNGIEIYRDRPRDEWNYINGQIRMASDPVDIRGLLLDAEQSGRPWTGLPAGTTLGHIHLQVGDIEQATEFYHRVLGFDIVASMPSALFISAGGYHHHIGMNTWHSRNAPAAPAGTAGLRFFTIVLPTDDARRDVLARIQSAGLSYTRSGDTVVLRDPFGNTILLVVGHTRDAAASAALIDAAQEATATH